MLFGDRIVWYVIGRYNASLPAEKWVDDTLVGMNPKVLARIEDSLVSEAPDRIAGRVREFIGVLKSEVLPVQRRLLRVSSAWRVIGSFMASAFSKRRARFSVNVELEPYDEFMVLSLSDVVPVPIAVEDEGVYHVYKPTRYEEGLGVPFGGFIARLTGNLIRSAGHVDLDAGTLRLGPLTFTFESVDDLLKGLEQIGLKEYGSRLLWRKIRSQLTPRLRRVARWDGEKAILSGKATAFSAPSGEGNVTVMIYPSSPPTVDITATVEIGGFTTQHQAEATLDNLAEAVQEAVSKAHEFALSFVRVKRELEREAKRAGVGKERFTVKVVKDNRFWWAGILYPLRGLPIVLDNLYNMVARASGAKDVKVKAENNVLEVWVASYDASNLTQIGRRALRVTVDYLSTVIEARKKHRRVGPEHVLALYLFKLVNQSELMVGIDPERAREMVDKIMDKVIPDYIFHGYRSTVAMLAERGFVSVDWNTGTIQVLGRPLHEILRGFPGIARTGLEHVADMRYDGLLSALKLYYGDRVYRVVEEKRPPLYRAHEECVKKLLKTSWSRGTLHILAWHSNTVLEGEAVTAKGEMKGARIGDYIVQVVGFKELSRGAPKAFAVFREGHPTGLIVTARTMEEAVKKVEENYEWVSEELERLEREGGVHPIPLPGGYRLLFRGGEPITLELLEEEGRRVERAHHS